MEICLAVIHLPCRMTIGVRADVKVSFLKSLFDGVSHLLITGFLRLIYMKIEQKVRAGTKKGDCKISLTFRADNLTGGYEMELDGVIYVFNEVLKAMKSNG